MMSRPGKYGREFKLYWGKIPVRTQRPRKIPQSKLLHKGMIERRQSEAEAEQLIEGISLNLSNIMDIYIILTFRPIYYIIMSLIELMKIVLTKLVTCSVRNNVKHQISEVTQTGNNKK